jgi:hypothetical protein
LGKFSKILFSSVNLTKILEIYWQKIPQKKKKKKKKNPARSQSFCFSDFQNQFENYHPQQKRI